MFGYDKNELIGKNIIELLIAEESRDRVKQNIKKGCTKSYQVTGTKKDGTRFPLEIEARNITINKKTICVAAFRDISLRVKAEDALLKSEDKFRKAFSTSPDAITISEMETGKYFNINKSFTEILGYNEKDAIGKTSIELGLWKNPETRNKIATIIKTKGILNNYEATFISKYGEEIYGLLSGAVIELSGKLYLLTITRDITDRIKAQTKLKQLNNKLKQQNEEYEKLNNDLKKSMEQIRQINRELEIAKHKAEESDRLKSAFLANMSHEIRTPMNGILGFSSLLRNTELTDKERLSYINIIDTSGKRLLNIINDLIDISKIEAGQMPVRLSECNVTEHIEELNKFFSLEAKQKGLELICQKTNVSEPPVITTDISKFNAVFTNLLKNAIKYTQNGNITFGFTPKGKYLEFFVKDTGIGIPKNRIKAIFDRFVQADIEDRDAYEGAGLGLAITRAYVEMLGGKIWVDSVEGKGSTFYFTLPVGSGKTITPLKSTKPEPEKQEQILNILIVEDEKFSYELLKIILRKVSNKIYFAKTGKEAIEIIKNNDDINLVLMDIKMPGIDGFETSREIRKINNDIKIIAQTAYVLKDDKGKKLENEFDAYVTKPIDKTDLLKKIKMLF
jgi:PAS domain S-box-containing protein